MGAPSMSSLSARTPPHTHSTLSSSKKCAPGICYLFSSPPSTVPRIQHMLQLKRVQFPCKLPTKRAAWTPLATVYKVHTFHTQSTRSMFVIYDSIDFPSSPSPSPLHPHLFKSMFARLFYLFICYPISFHISIDSHSPPLPPSA